MSHVEQMHVRREPNPELLAEFRRMLELLGKAHNFSCCDWPGAKTWPEHVIELSGSVSGLLYVHYRSEGEGWWGVAKERLSSVAESERVWWLVLLLEMPDSGYILNAAAAEDLRVNKHWGEPTKSGGVYQVHESRRSEMEGSKQFGSLRLEDLYEILHSEWNEERE